MGAAQICHAVGRVMLVVIFMWSAINNWRNSATATAKMAQNGFPEGSAGIALTMATVVAMIGSLLVLLNIKVGVGAAMMITFLLPVTYFMHFAPWSTSVAIDDDVTAANEWAMLLKNVAILGSLLMICSYEMQAPAGSKQKDD